MLPKTVSHLACSCTSCFKVCYLLFIHESHILSEMLRSQDNVQVVCIVTGLHAVHPTRAADFPLLQNVHASYVAHQAPC